MEKQQGDGARWGSTQQRSAADSRHHAVVPMPSFVCSHSAADGRRRKTRAGAKPGDCIPVREPTHRTSQPPPTAAGRSPNPKKHPFSDRLPRRSGDRRAARRRGGSTVTNARFGTVTSITHGTLEMPEARVPSAPTAELVFLLGTDERKTSGAQPLFRVGLVVSSVASLPGARILTGTPPAA